ncbi:uncharacterized protein Z518_07959 [Rhinocladiella mackenziei CBS 650.93]|uniref:Ketoreductase domain-containing protein n=1 Tax=Rhinocladiella mackenziei CBS 650.93 TaxID=1442369 RepID=A0A0D2IZI6_9EURO|nr:uncharacterized protein Z518_07959 [Rhinocladiella mackenziei CBS 650.93]KIX02020.1 hypothetical protein Z518_07959 [Rhinocladiella mackenziei CBS 650.93]
MTELPSYTKKWHNDVYPSINASRPELSAKGKRIVITGGAGGIGAATAEAFIVAGASEVIILGRTEKTLQSAKSAIENKYHKATVVALVSDITDPQSTTQAFDTISKRGSIDVFINNAGYLSDIGPAATSDVAEWWRSFEVNVRGSLQAVQAALKNISNNGVIINVTSAAALVPSVPGHSAYAVSKIGSTKLFEYIQHENTTIRIFNLQPGIIESTGMASKAAEQSGISWPQQDTLQLPAHFMVWLSSPEGAFLKGRFVWANWDIDELRAKAKDLEENPTMLTLGLIGWPQ